MSQEWVIRTAQRSDAPTIYSIHQASLTTLCRTHYPLDVLERWFSTKTVEGYIPAIDRGEMFVCERQQMLAGFGHAFPGEVEGIFVHPAFARQGIGEILLRHAIHCASEHHSGPIKIFATLNAQTFYEKHGFCEVQRYIISRNDVDFPVVEMVLSRGSGSTQ